MNKKILIIGILTVLILMTISFATAVSSNTNTCVKNNESPLFGIRTRSAIGEKLQDLTRRFVRNRIFFVSFQSLFNKEDLSIRNLFESKDYQYTHAYLYCTCPGFCQFTGNTYCYPKTTGCDTCEGPFCTQGIWCK